MFFLSVLSGFVRENNQRPWPENRNLNFQGDGGVSKLYTWECRDKWSTGRGHCVVGTAGHSHSVDSVSQPGQGMMWRRNIYRKTLLAAE